MGRVKADRDAFQRRVEASVEALGAGHVGPVVFFPKASEVARDMGLNSPGKLYQGYDWRERAEHTLPEFTIVHDGLVLARTPPSLSVHEVVESTSNQAAQVERILEAMSPEQRAQTLGSLILRFGVPQE